MIRLEAQYLDHCSALISSGVLTLVVSFTWNFVKTFNYFKNIFIAINKTNEFVTRRLERKGEGDVQRRRTISLLQAEPARRPATMVKTRCEAATPCSAGLLSIFGAGGGVRPRDSNYQSVGKTTSPINSI